MNGQKIPIPLKVVINYVHGTNLLKIRPSGSDSRTHLLGADQM